VTAIASPAFAPVRRIILPCGTLPKAVIAAEQRALVRVDIGGKASGEGRQPCFIDAVRQGQCEQETERFRALRGKIGKIGAQRLLRHRVGGIAPEEVNALDDRVGRQDEIVSGRRRDGRRVVAQIEGARIAGQRPEETSDQTVLAGRFCAHALLRSLLILRDATLPRGFSE
jgi:hypothetical protein